MKMNKIGKPYVLNLPVTEICDSKCVMCNVWNAGKVDQLNADNIEKIFGDEFFSSVKHIGLSGGEPTLNKQLVLIVNKLLGVFRKLETMSITSHGYHTDKHRKILPVIKKACDEKGVKFSLNLSLDGYKDAHFEIRRIEDAFEKVTSTAFLARSFGVPVQFQCTISPLNAFSVVFVREFAIKNEFEIVFRVATEIARLSNSNLVDSIALSSQQRSFFADFLVSERTMRATKSLSRRLFYTDLSRRLLNGGTRKAPCAFQNNGYFISPSLQVYNCSRADLPLQLDLDKRLRSQIGSVENGVLRESLVSEKCQTCYHDQNGRWPLWKYLLVHDRLLKAFRQIGNLYNVFGSLRLKSLFPTELNSDLGKQVSFKRALVIGCYGGEHVGDAAILGGVILRFISRIGLKEVVVASLRPERTKWWCSNLQLNDLSIEVIDYSNSLNISDFDCLILAGGPVMEINSLLLKHHRTASEFIKNNKPFFVEGVGIGPYKSLLGKSLIKKLLKKASSVSVRTEDDLGKAINLTIKSPLPSVDPAFDYLAYRIQSLKPSRGNILRQLGIEDSDKYCVINLRPLWSKYSNGKTNLAYLEQKIISEVCSFIEKCDTVTKFVFMPMNADQYGFSDLEIAFGLESNLKDSSKLIVWQHEPSIDECLYLLSGALFVVSMRFHGCIFALSSGIKTIGLDYSTGAKGKVQSLFDSLDLGKYVINISDLTHAKLLKLTDRIG